MAEDLGEVYAPICLTVAELVEMELPEFPILVEPWLPKDGLGLIFGDGGVGKSILTLQLANCVAKGEPFLGFQTNPGPVVYIQADMAAVTQHKRVKEQAGELHGDLIFVLDQNPDLMALTPRSRFVQEINAREPVMIVGDTVRKLHRGDENDSRVASTFYQHARELFPRGVLQWVHHTRKPSSDPKARNARRFRGSSAWVDDVDLAIDMSAFGGKGNRKLVFEKARVCDQPEPVFITLDPALMQYHVSNPTVTAVGEAILSEHPNIEHQDFVQRLMEEVPTTSEKYASNLYYRLQ